ncbi:nb-arc ankyrin domain-containing protein [Fusarium denticulatum]|uniref:Nb-arc ankyrin domain-containing protein n=1 Tax=Fusarium denticulatum TaxID=48507 RepID=A0A8H5WCX0_9HYPO|nr:nb-arc ankyrin domain-containing protein [Fusarium denticulatum]
MESSIRDTGISIVYEPENRTSVVDILFVHGLGGHPRKTWTSSKRAPVTPELLSASESLRKNLRKNSHKSALGRALSQLHRMTRNTAAEARPETLHDIDADPALVFWPVDLLSRDCPDSRILVFGYDSKITKYSTGSVSENSVFSHAKDLLFALGLERPLNRPLICVAHSLGGIIFKEMLSRASSSTRYEHQNVLESVEAVIFLGTPHRGSVDIAAKGEVARSLLSALGVATTPVILDSLGLKNTDLERAQEEFSRLWHTSNFRVKTFQEGLILPKLGKKVVPEYSSLIGNHQEHAETLQADHLEMCRYSGKDDPNYRKVAGEILSTYLSITTSDRQESTGHYSPVPSVGVSQHVGDDFHSQASKVCLQSLWFPAISRRYETLGSPAEQTCHWLFDDENFQDWLSGRNKERHQGLIWIKGKPGSGKSMLMGEAFRRATQRQEKAPAPSQTAAFFFNGKGDELEHSAVGLFRSLIYQLCSKHPPFLYCFQDIWNTKVKTTCFTAPEHIAWHEAELKTAFEKMMLQKRSSRVLIFIDALDECDSSSVRNLAYFWRKITKSAFASGIDLKVCISSRHSPSVTVSDCPEVIMEQHNSLDISTHINQRIEIGIGIQNAQWQALEEKIREMSDGMFLWVDLVVDDLLRSWDEGRSLEYLVKRVENTPQVLETLFSEMLSNLTPEGKNITVKLFQWATLSTKPLRLHEWHHILGFIRHPTSKSLAEWRASDYFTETDEQLVKQINTLSLGLIEVTGAMEVPPHDSGSDISSVGVDAGSLTLEYGGTRIVQVIHESVRDFFLRGNGFSVLDPSLSTHAIGTGHLSIMATCLDYVNIGELDALVAARQRVTSREKSPIFSTKSNSDCSLSVCSLGYEEHPPQGTITLPLRRKRIREDDRRPEQTISDFPGSYPFTAVHQWLEESRNSTAESDLLIKVPQAAYSDVSDTFSSQILEDHPALLSYATFALFEHACLADIDGADITPILDRLNDDSTWARWKSLREDVPQGTELLDFLCDLGLVSWISAFHGRFSRGQKRQRSSPPSEISTGRRSLSSTHQPSGDEKRRSTFRGLISLPQVESQEHPPPMSPPKWRGESPQSLNRVPRRRGSVASFGSASSHDGYGRHSPKFESPRPVNPKHFGGTKVAGFFMCECCPKKPKKFDTLEELNAHEAEKQYECSFCGNRFKNKNEAERHQNSLHIRRQSWSCSYLLGYDSAFQESSQRPEKCDTCGYCGDDFPRSGAGTGDRAHSATDQDWDERIRHLQEIHKFRECHTQVHGLTPTWALGRLALAALPLVAKMLWRAVEVTLAALRAAQTS